MKGKVNAALLAVLVILLLINLSQLNATDELSNQPVNDFVHVEGVNESSIVYPELIVGSNEEETEKQSGENTPEEEPPEILEEPIEAFTFYVTEYPAEAVVVTGSTGGLGLYLIGFRRQRSELKKALSAAGAWRTKGGGHLESSFKALGILTKARAAAFALGPLSWTWDEMLFEAMSNSIFWMAK